MRIRFSMVNGESQALKTWYTPSRAGCSRRPSQEHAAREATWVREVDACCANQYRWCAGNVGTFRHCVLLRIMQRTVHEPIKYHLKHAPVEATVKFARLAACLIGETLLALGTPPFLASSARLLNAPNSPSALKGKQHQGANRHSR